MIKNKNFELIPFIKTSINSENDKNFNTNFKIIFKKIFLKL